jgi:hypothetical protein
MHKIASQRRLKLSLNLDNLLRRPLIRISLMEPLNIRKHIWKILLLHAATTIAGFERKAHQDICSRDLLAAEILASVR